MIEDSRRVSKPSFKQVYGAWNWQPIPNCPGRYILRQASKYPSIEALAAGEIEVTEHRTDAARDTVLVATIEEGGIVSYLRADGSFVHTLNTREGFERKLKQLGIDL